MPNKRANVENEKQYEKLKGEGHVEGARGEDRELAGRVEPRRQEVRLRRLFEAGRYDRAEEGSGPQGRPRHRAEELGEPL
jgi:hypothetical protein